MKVLLTTLNAKFIHSSLALRYLEGTICNLPGIEVERLEFTINTHLPDILGEIYAGRACVVALSSYIWNIGQVLRLAANLKKVAPETVVILGGPEVSYETGELMQQHPEIDFVVTGEGEETFPRLIQMLAGQAGSESDNGRLEQQLQETGGIYWRQGGEICQSGAASLISTLDTIPSPYRCKLAAFKDQIAYVETSRGCPYSCGYCLSAIGEGVRYFSLPRVKDELARLIDAGAKQVKFVDRTFNVNKSRALEIWRFLMAEQEQRGGISTNFHFEINADLLDEEMLELLGQVPPGLFQFEIGIQSTNALTLEAITRVTKLDRLVKNVERLRRTGNIHLHLDLIAGLPYEDLPTFINSFNKVLALNPHRLQLGFLKMLKGTSIRGQAGRYGYRYDAEAPYQILANDLLSFADILLLQEVAELVERVYNSNHFFYAVQYILAGCRDRFRFFRELLETWKSQALSVKEVRQKNIYALLLKFCREQMAGEKAETVRELLILDLLRQQRLSQLPDWASAREVSGEVNGRSLADRTVLFLNDDQVRSRFFPGRENLTYRKLANLVQFVPVSSETAGFVLERPETTGGAVFLFDYCLEQDPVIGGARFYPVELPD